MEKRDLEQRRPEKWDMVTLFKSSNLTKVKEIHLIGRLRREPDGAKSSTAASKELLTTIIPSIMC